MRVQRRRSSNRSSELIGLYREVEKLQKSKENIKKKLKYWQELFVEYSAHKDSCRIIEIQESGRVPNLKHCTCGRRDLVQKTRLQDKSNDEG